MCNYTASEGRSAAYSMFKKSHLGNIWSTHNVHVEINANVKSKCMKPFGTEEL